MLFVGSFDAVLEKCHCIIWRTDQDIMFKVKTLIGHCYHDVIKVTRLSVLHLLTNTHTHAHIGFLLLLHVLSCPSSLQPCRRTHARREVNITIISDSSTEAIQFDGNSEEQKTLRERIHFPTERNCSVVHFSLS